MSFIYLATPHNHDDPEIREERFKAAQLAAATVYAHCIPVYSPIAHWHPIAQVHSLPHGWFYWKQQDEAMLKNCLELWVITIEGWETSKGIKAEVAFAKHMESKDIRYIDPADLDEWCIEFNRRYIII